MRIRRFAPFVLSGSQQTIRVVVSEAIRVTIRTIAHLLVRREHRWGGDQKCLAAASR